ncbi:MAG: ABC transporter ATP-binding protein [Candidatus Saganbacteria bacterium]|nr:ABC transporter ATP-binding protein [Candidatus Saganbacteria bacterium]
MIKITSLTKTFGNKKVLDDVSLEIPDGQKLAVIGPSGCGKSTLLRLLIGLTGPTRGSVNINGKEITVMSEDRLMKIRAGIGMVFQSSALFDSMSVYENIAFGLRQNSGLPEDLIRKKVAEKLEMVELPHIEGLMPGELSGGMQKRVSFARAIANDPSIILYDEPTTGLDPVTSTVIEDLINKLTRELKATGVLVTHQLSTIFRTSDRIVMMNESKFIEAGSVEQAINSSNPIVKNFIKGGLP